MTKVKKKKTKEIEKEDPIDLTLNSEDDEEDLSWMIEDNDIKKDNDGKKI
jgi:hypothetical protein